MAIDSPVSDDYRGFWSISGPWTCTPTVWGAILDICCWRISFSLSTSFEHKKRIRVLVPRLQFRKRENHPWTSVTFDKVAGFSVAQRSYEILSVCLSVCQLVRFFDFLFLRKLLPDLREEIFWLFIGQN